MPQSADRPFPFVAQAPVAFVGYPELAGESAVRVRNPLGDAGPEHGGGLPVDRGNVEPEGLGELPDRHGAFGLDPAQQDERAAIQPVIASAAVRHLKDEVPVDQHELAH